MRYRALPALVLCCALACQREHAAIPAFSDEEIARVMLGFADDVVMPTYAQVAAAAADLATTVEALAASPTQEHLATAQQAWLVARRPWEASESFLTGPVVAFSLDPAIDSWPVSELEIDELIASDETLSPSAAAAWPGTQRGFHGLGYVLFGLAQSRNVAELTPRHLQYASAVATVLATEAQQLLGSWDEPFYGARTFRELLLGGGAPWNEVYHQPLAALSEIAAGISGVLDEVALAKLGAPYFEGDEQLLESRYSQTSLADFADNLRGAHATYLGYAIEDFDVVTPLSPSPRSLASLVIATDPQLHQRLLDGFAACQTAMAMIAEPYEQAIVDPAFSAAISATIDALLALRNLFDGELAVTLAARRAI